MASTRGRTSISLLIEKVVCLLIFGNWDFLLAQKHGNGLSKTTYAGSADGSFEALHWMIAVLNMTPAMDSSFSNVQRCEKGTSGVSEDWLITMQRGETVLQDVAVGTCHIHYGESVSKQSNLISGGTALTPPSIPGYDCSYDVGSTFVNVEGSVSIVNAHAPDTCCKSCVADPECKAASFYPVPEDVQNMRLAEPHDGPGPQPGEFFGLHVTSVQGHSDWPGMTVEAVEQIFTEKLGKMTKFDWFMDYNVAFYTTDLDVYLARLDDFGSKWMPAFWEVSSGNSTIKGYSCFIHVGHSQLVVEITSFKSLRLSEKKLHKLEPRVTDLRVEKFLSEYHADVVVASVSRAVSSHAVLDDVERFYLKGVGASLTMSLDHYQSSQTSVPMSKRCFQWPQTVADVCFTTYAESSATAGSFTPSLFEAMLHATHEHWIKGAPGCANDRWLDNHYAVDLGWNRGTGSDSNHFDGPRLLDYVLEEGLLYTCGGGPRGLPTDGAHYVVDPTGWAVQLDLAPGSRAMPGCEDIHDGGDNKYHPGPSSWCTMGTCTAESRSSNIADEGPPVEGGSEGVEFPTALVFGFLGAVAAFCFGFFRGGGTPQALVLGKGEYELVSREAMLTTEDEEDDDIGTEDI